MTGWNEDSVSAVQTPDYAPPIGAGEPPQLSGIIEKALNEICGLVCHITGAHAVIVAQRDPSTKTIRVRGKKGTLLTEVDMTFVIPQLNAETKPMLLARDVRIDPHLHNHPLLGLMPHMHSLMAFLIPGLEVQSRAVMKVINPRKTAFNDGDLISVLSELCVIVADLLQIRRQSEDAEPYQARLRNMLHGLQLCNGGDGDVAPRQGQHGSSASAFLFDTLIRKRGLHSRNSVDYMSLRTWRSSIKKYQIAALRALKLDPPPEFVSRVAAELAASVEQAHGQSVIKSVVPIPPGSSGRETSLSTLVAEELARLLGASCQNVLVPLAPSKRGNSSPRKSADFAGYKTVEHVRGPIIVVDDVASSGRHIELAVEACKAADAAVYAVAWIAK